MSDATWKLLLGVGVVFVVACGPTTCTEHRDDNALRAENADLRGEVAQLRDHARAAFKQQRERYVADLGAVVAQLRSETAASHASAVRAALRGIDRHVVEHVLPFQGFGSGTCFSTRLGSERYLITARHLIEEISPNPLAKPATSMVVQVEVHGRWVPCRTAVVRCAVGDVDAVALRLLDDPPVPAGELRLAADTLNLGQPVWFLGFAMKSGSGALGRVTPFVKNAYLAGWSHSPMGGSVLNLDGHNLRGMSGGPVVYVDPETRQQMVAAVIAAYRVDMEPVLRPTEHGLMPIADLQLRVNTGLIEAWNINQVRDAILADQATRAAQAKKDVAPGLPR